eukprot:TRINITY_DN20777_c0_g1_i1.p1 TRINITY_DN20777_c0_g1~~TRINITY_DN20777_c0_g1_i1.p1  ORF type:complete len:120 (-),score=33.06 TRINITY_DN20777_c0_g1_i1:137-496(-)
MGKSFKNEYTFEERAAEAARMKARYGNRVPVIVEKASRTDVQDMDKKKYLVPVDLTVGQFVHILSKRLKLQPGEALFIFVGDVLPQTAAMMGAVYEEYKDEDGFLYVTYSGEKTFGTVT